MERTTDISRRLEGAWKRERRFFGSRGFLHFVLWATILLAADFVLDFHVRLPGRWRLVLLLANAAVLLAVLFWTWGRRLRRFDGLKVALQVERLYPGLGSLLVSYVQFSGGSGDGIASPALIEAMRRQAQAQTARMDFGKIVRFRSLRRVLVGAAAAVAIAVMAGWAWPRHLHVFMARMASPALDIGYPTRTVIDIDASSGSLAVQQGRTVVLRAVVGGVLPAQARLTLAPEQGRSETISLPALSYTGKGTCEFVYRVEDVYRDFSYRFHAGDDVSRLHKVSVIAPPVVDPKVELQFPDYCGRKPEQIETLNFDALEGARILWRMKADRPLKSAAMVREDGQALPMTLSADGRTATVALEAGKSFSYGFRWVDEPYRFVYEPDVRYAVSVVPDRAPRVSLLLPSRDETVTTRKTVDVVFQADDDFGVASARIVYQVQRWGEPKMEVVEKDVPVKTFAKATCEVKESFRWDVRAAIPDLKAGDAVLYGVEVVDSRAKAPGRGRSLLRRLNVVSDEEYVRMALERRKDLLEKIKDVYQQEGKAAEAVKVLKDKE